MSDTAGSTPGQGPGGDPPLHGLADRARENAQESVAGERDALDPAEEDTTPGTGGLVPPDDAQSAPPAS